MFNILVFLLIITSLAVGAAWIAEHPGSVTLYWFDYRIDTNVAFLLLIIAGSVIVCSCIYWLFHKIVVAPEQISTRRKLRRTQLGLQAVTHSVAALAASDAKSAAIHTKRAEKLLGGTPLTLLLSAQLARSQGNDAKTYQLLEAMLAHKETEYLAARSLSDHAHKQHLMPQALGYAQRALAVHPKEKSACLAVIGLHLKQGEWQEALSAIAKSSRKRSLSHQDVLRLKGLTHMQQGEALLKEGKKGEALACAKQVLKTIPRFAPAIAFAARTFHANTQTPKALGMLAAAWKRVPNAPLTTSFVTLLETMPKDKAIKLAQKLARSRKGLAESHLLLAQTALKFAMYDIVRKELAAALALQETTRVCLLMAEVEKRHHADHEAEARWLTRAASAPDGADWVCGNCPTHAASWQMHCESCGAFDRMEWQEHTPEIIA